MHSPSSETMPPKCDNKISAEPLDGKILSLFFYDLNIFLKNLSAYPKQHPMINYSKLKVLSTLDRLLSSREELCVIISRNSLLVDKNNIDPENPVFRNLAENLFAKGIAAVVFKRGLEGEELDLLHEILSLDRELTWQEGVIEKRLVERGAGHLLIERVDYASFYSTEGNEFYPRQKEAIEAEATLFWQHFIQRILNEKETMPKKQTGSSKKFQPEGLATTMNSRSKEASPTAGDEYEDAVDYFISHLKEEVRPKDRADLIKNLDTLVRTLNPELRSRFVRCLCNSVNGSEDLAGEIFDTFPKEIIQETLAGIGPNRDNVPYTILQLLEKLYEKKLSTGAASPTSVSTTVTGAELDTLKIISREESSGYFIPAGYREQLSNTISTRGIPEHLRQTVEDMKGTLSVNFIENSIGMIILELFDIAPDEEQTEQLTKTLLDLSSYLLETGDFVALTTIYDRFKRIRPSSAPGMQSAYEKITGTFTDPTFLAEVLNGLDFWGKTKFEGIGGLIKQIGAPFVTPLLNRLADEPNISTRRYYMERLTELGDATCEAVLTRLDDSRWYFVRNMVILLRGTGGPSILPTIRMLALHPRIKVRQEALKTLLHYCDPEADRLLQLDMLSKDKGICLSAIRLAEKSRNPETCRILFWFIGKTGFTNFELERKRAAVQALAVTGNPEALPILLKLFQTKNFLHPKKQYQLRLEIVRSLGRYPVASVTKVLEDIVDSSPRELSELARDLLDNIGGNGA